MIEVKRQFKNLQRLSSSSIINSSIENIFGFKKVSRKKISELYDFLINNLDVEFRDTPYKIKRNYTKNIYDRMRGSIRFDVGMDLFKPRINY